ncbi:MAG: Fic family protein, partial [Ruminiclostridium sp.]
MCSLPEILARIDTLLNELNSYRLLTTSEVKRLKEEFLIDFTYNSNAIEGNTLTLQETALILNEGITIGEKSLREHLEVIGHKEAYLYLEDIVKEQAELSEKVIKDIHSLVLMEQRENKGIYRRVPVVIMGAAHTPPQPYLVPVQMEQLIQDYGQSSSNHIVERVAKFHLDFEAVHPFIDGNGRMGRLILNLELMKHGYPPINIKYSDRKKYYECFTSYHTKNDPIEMVLLIAKSVEAEIQRYIEIITIANDITNSNCYQESSQQE